MGLGIGRGKVVGAVAESGGAPVVGVWCAAKFPGSSGKLLCSRRLNFDMR